MLSGKRPLNKRDAFESFNTEWANNQYENNLELIFFFFPVFEDQHYNQVWQEFVCVIKCSIIIKHK